MTNRALPNGIKNAIDETEGLRYSINMIAQTVYWLFQVLNTLTAISLFLTPRKAHESMFKDPAAVYTELGFSTTALEMLHHVLRGQGAALLAISLFLYVTGPANSLTFLLIALTCGLTLIAHIATAQHHRKNPVVMKAIGTIGALIPMIGINAGVALTALFVYLRG